MNPSLHRLFAAVIAVVALVAAPLADTVAAPPPSDAPPNVTIAYQPGIGYANLIVVKEQGTLEREFPNTHFEWKVLSSGSAIRDAMIADQVQIGSSSITPFLIAWDKGVDLRLITSLNEMNLWLVTRDPKVHSLADIKPGMQVGVPGVDSVQAIVLEKGAQVQLGKPHALDGNVLAIAHPLGLQALETGQLALHLSAPPFEFEEVQGGGHVVLRSYDLFGRSTFNTVYATQTFARQHPNFIASFARAIADATTLINQHPADAAALLSKDAGGTPSAATFAGWITHADVVYETTPHGCLAYARFMQSIGLLAKAPASMREIELPTLHGSGD
jgi:NitT/TauT family transport system substrate-binding protein